MALVRRLWDTAQFVLLAVIENEQRELAGFSQQICKQTPNLLHLSRSNTPVFLKSYSFTSLWHKQDEYGTCKAWWKAQKRFCD